MSFDNDPLERIADNRDKHSCCSEPVCFSPPFCLQRNNTSRKEPAQPSHLCLCGLYAVNSLYDPGKHHVPLSIIQESHRELASKDAFSVPDCWTFHWVTLQWFYLAKCKKKQIYCHKTGRVVGEKNVCTLKIRKLWLKRVDISHILY